MWLSQDCLDDIFRSQNIDFQGLFREIVCCRRDHATYMQHIIRAIDPGKHILVTGQISPYHGY